MPCAAPRLHSDVAPDEPVFVFGSDLAGKNDHESAALAMRLHAAEPGTRSGPTGNAYAIPVWNSVGALLPLEVIRNYTESFVHHAQANPGSRFQVARFGCEPGAHDDAEMAGLFENAPKNCQLPGVWARLRDPRLPARLLVLDPGARLREAAWQSRLERYLALNAPLWSAPAVELVSVGHARSLVANDIAAKELGLRHRVFGPNEAYYGAHAVVAAEHKAVWYATHVLSISDFDQTAQPQQIRVVSAATRGGLQVDQIDANGIC